MRVFDEEGKRFRAGTGVTLAVRFLETRNVVLVRGRAADQAVVATEDQDELELFRNEAKPLVEDFVFLASPVIRGVASVDEDIGVRKAIAVFLGGDHVVRVTDDAHSNCLVAVVELGVLDFSSLRKERGAYSGIVVEAAVNCQNDGDDEEGGADGAEALTDEVRHPRNKRD